MVYGGKEINKTANRNLAIEWENADGLQTRSGLRLTSVSTAGIGYEPDQVATVAGAINTMHDLIGMIIVDASSDDPEDQINDGDSAALVDSNKIYWQDEKYFRVGVDYQVTETEDNNPRAHFEPTTLDQGETYKYFKKYGQNYTLIRNVNEIEKDHKYYT